MTQADQLARALEALCDCISETRGKDANDALRNARQALAAYRAQAGSLHQAPQWQSIETAPKDGTAVLAYIPDAYAHVDIVAWGCDGASGQAWCRARCADGLKAGNPTHWMPLPANPTQPHHQPKGDPMISDILDWFRKAVPSPTDKNRAVQLGVHFEEVAEMCDVFGDDLDVADALKDISAYYKRGCPGITAGRLSTADRIELLDALCDQIVTAVGVAHMFKLDISRGLFEVNRSNWSKFVNGQPQWDLNGKISKGPDYSKPDLTRFV